MMGEPISGPTYIYGDNMSVIHNTQRPESVLKEKTNSICYHAIRESVAMGESPTTHVPTALNPADICTKVISGGKKSDDVIDLILYEIN
jgi:ABC-type thiamine transport system ATPase subunit